MSAKPGKDLPRWKRILKDANWLNARRAADYPKIFLSVYVVAALLYLLASPHLIDPLGKPVGTDFMNVWAAGKMAGEGRAAGAYDWNLHAMVERATLPYEKDADVSYFGWHYPPMFMMVAAVLALLPYGFALLAWMAATLPVYIAAIRAALPEKLRQGRGAVYAALAFPAVFVNLGHGQNGFLSAGLMGFGVMQLEKRPYLAGVLFGLLAYKPQFGLLVPVALLLGWHWRAIFAAGITVVITAALSFALFGEETWRAFFGSLKLTRSVVLEQGSTGWEKIQSIFSAVRMLGGSVDLAYAAQALFACFAAGAVAWAWKSRADMRLKGAVLALGCLLATPYSLDYDLVLLALPIAWWLAAALEGQYRPYEKTVLAAAYMLPLFARSLGMIYIPVTPFFLVVMMWMVLQRISKTPVPHSYLRV